MVQLKGNRRGSVERWGLRRRFLLVAGASAAIAAAIVAAGLSGVFPFPAIPFLLSLAAPVHLAILAALAGLAGGFLVAVLVFAPVVRGLHLFSGEIQRSGFPIQGRMGIGRRMNQILLGIRDLAGREREAAKSRETLETYVEEVRDLEARVARAIKEGESPAPPEDGPFRAMEEVATRVCGDLVRYRRESGILLGQVAESMDGMTRGVDDAARLAEKSFVDATEAGVMLRDLAKVVERMAAASREGKMEADPGHFLLRLRDDLHSLLAKLEAISRTAEGASRTAHRAGRDAVEVEREVAALRERIGGERVERLSERNFVPDSEEPEDLS